MKLLNYLKYAYYSVVLWLESFGSDSKSERLFMPQDEFKQQHRRNDKLARGTKHLVRWLRSIGPDGRAKLIKEDANILMQSGRARELSTLEKMEQARAMAKLMSGPKVETEEQMARTFVKNQGKYKLQAQKRNVYKDLQSGKLTAKEAQVELLRINNELRKY